MFAAMTRDSVHATQHDNTVAAAASAGTVPATPALRQEAGPARRARRSENDIAAISGAVP